MLHLPISPILAELGALVPSVEGSALHLYSTSLAFWEGDSPPHSGSLQDFVSGNQ
jgi:hypothetical protein